MSTVLGIDFGTSNSSCAIANSEDVLMIPSRFGSPHIPSVIGLDSEGQLLVGEPARRQLLVNYENTIYGFKRFMGRKYHSRVVQQLKEYFHFHLEGGPQGEVLFRLRERRLTDEELSAVMLTDIRRMAERHLNTDGPVREAIVSVPAYFTHAQRQSIRGACSKAGLFVRKIINEPTAAALAYGYDRGLHETVLIYDLGGGTFDVTVMEIDGSTYQVLATTGDTLLGGLDFDNRIVEHWAEQIERDHRVDPFDSMEAIQRLRDAAERTKIELSGNAQSRVGIPRLLEGSEGRASLDFNTVLSVDMLNDLTVNLVERTLGTCQKALRMAGKGVRDIDEVILVGGQTWMPLIRRKIEAFFGRQPTKRIHPMEAVARGCSIQAAIFEQGLEGVNEVYLHDVLPQSIGIQQEGASYREVFPANHRTNSRLVLPLTTNKDNQTSIILSIRQGEEANPDDNELLGIYEFAGLPPRPRGRCNIEVEFFVDKQCMLSVVGRDVETGKEYEAQF